MDDKEKLRRLYNKMIIIKNKTIGLSTSINNLEEELNQTLLINNKTYKVNDIKIVKNTTKEVRKNIRYEILNHIRENL